MTAFMPAKPVITSAANQSYQAKLDRLKAMAEAGDWSGVAAFEVKGSNSYSKIVARYRDGLLAYWRSEIDAFEAEDEVAEYFGTGSKKPRGRGMAQKSVDLIEAMAEIAEAASPVTGRGIGYKLFTAGLIPSMSRSNMHRVYRLLKQARERGLISWEWIVDENRSLERKAAWSDPEEFARAATAQYRRDFWDVQPKRVEVWSEKGTIRGVLAPVLDKYGVGFRVMHGFSGATTVHEIAQDDDGRDLVALYVGDYDPSGMWMSERDLPHRVDKYGGDHVFVKRIAIVQADTMGLPSFPAEDKRKDTRYDWFVKNYGDHCWELDALDPNTLRDRVEESIFAFIEPVAWSRCAAVNKAEQESLRTILSQWHSAGGA